MADRIPEKCCKGDRETLHWYEPKGTFLLHCPARDKVGEASGILQEISSSLSHSIRLCPEWWGGLEDFAVCSPVLPHFQQCLHDTGVPEGSHWPVLQPPWPMGGVPYQPKENVLEPKPVGRNGASTWPQVCPWGNWRILTTDGQKIKSLEGSDSFVGV